MRLGAKTDHPGRRHNRASAGSMRALRTERVLMPVTSQTKTLAANLMAYGASEVAAKASRLLVVVAVARMLDLTEIGIAAAAIALGDILKSLTENGVGQRIIAAKDQALASTCAAAHKIFWLYCIGLFLTQCALAGMIFVMSAQPLLAGLVLLMGVEYLFMPAGLVQVALAMRAGKLKQTAAINGAQVVGANLISIGLVLVWPSAIAMILPRVLSAPIWLLAVRKLHPWHYTPETQRAPFHPFLKYGWAVLSIEVVKVLRLQADKLVVGATLGAETLALYFMAFNAGLSLSNAFSTAFSTVLFPMLAQTADRASMVRQSIGVGLGMIAPVVVIQALAAPFYIPLLLGSGWDKIVPLVQMLCLVAIPTTVWASAAGWLRTAGRPETELLVTCVLTTAVIANAGIYGPHGVFALTAGYAAVTALIMLLASAFTLRIALKPTPVERFA